MSAIHIDWDADGAAAEIRVSGRLDNDGAGQLTTVVDEALRQGNHSIAVDLTAIEFISSAGIGALLKAHKQLRGIRGRFGVVGASPQVAEVIRLTGLNEMLLRNRESRRSMGTVTSTIQADLRFSDRGDLSFEVYDDPAGRPVKCELYGEPVRLSQGEFPASQCRKVSFPAGTMGLGLGAFGDDYAGCAAGFGEFLAAGGTAVHQAPAGTARPDYQRVMGEFVPSVQVLYGLRCQGDLARLVRFDRVDDDRRLPFSAVVDQMLTLSDGPLAAMVLVAESDGLIGARLRRSPAVSDAAAPERSRFDHPEIRRWLSYAPERAFAHGLALMVGVASRGSPTGPLAPFLRRLNPTSDVWGHFHAAAFSYRPFKKRRLELQETATSLCETEDVLAVLHLLHDDRPIIGGGESELTRGACWLGPIADVRTEGSV